MNTIKGFLSRIRVTLSKLQPKTYVTVLLEAIGLFANLIAIVSFFGIVNTPESSPNFYINNQEFLAWSTIAVIYTLGLILAKMKRRWRNKTSSNQYHDNLFSKFISYDSGFSWSLYKRNFSFTLVITFPITFLYIRAIQASTTHGTASPWTALGTTFLLSFPVTFAGMIISGFFDSALSLYEGD